MSHIICNRVQLEDVMTSTLTIFEVIE